MPGPTPKHPSIRARRNDSRKDFRPISSRGWRGRVPNWPLQPMPFRVARLEHARDAIAPMQVELEQTADGRKKGRLRRDLNKAEIEVARLELELEQATDAELSLWAELWRTPQAILWHEVHATREVAQYVRWKVAAEQGDIAAAKEARQLSDRLGLTPLALLRLRVLIEKPEPRGTGRPKPSPRPRRPRGDDPRRGLHAVG